VASELGVLLLAGCIASEPKVTIDTAAIATRR
jgi:hypothetical protein